MLTQLRPALTLLGAFSLMLGLAYPLAMTGFAQVLMPAQANGSLISRDGVIVGSSLIGQNFTRPEYLRSRPSAVDYDAAGSGGSNLGPSSAELLAQVRTRAAAFDRQPAPSDMATASASGLDPHISLASALAQVPRIAAARGLDEDRIRAAIRTATTGPAFGLVDGAMVNVLRANLALDAAGA
ncbi:potassium-transporting ATPase subunit KdpC [Paracoccus sp. S1E-3]|uniref:potassium-transporting ATPase subunit KdpC n=1 Tax=Paracoccus sp. S1E-3 TaxID=2756130 RepID=UPI0015EF5ECA|nr:potassium-transporting ATPase subunit KdpC [Paracoccus sp. S1E-3]MBA4489831.1 potassium-transporting ATPase subunit KdpC [Paracoccus sp. S1E-3]